MPDDTGHLRQVKLTPKVKGNLRGREGVRVRVRVRMRLG